MSCKIHLEERGGIYGPGSVVRGRVECTFKSEVTLRSIKIFLKCKERIEWQVQHSGYSETNKLFEQEELLLGPANPSTNCELPGGLYSYPFYFVLPHWIPSTFKGTFGYITYTLKAIVDIPLWKDYIDKIILMVHAPIIYNISSPQFPSKVAYENDKTVYLCCFNRGKLTMDVELPTSALVSGEVINFKVHVRNLSRQNVDDLTVKLQQKITYGLPLSSSYQCSEESLATLQEHGVGANGENMYDLFLKIPESCQVVNFTSSTLMRVEYTLEVCCNMFMGLRKLMICIPDINVGHAKCDANAVERVIYSVDPRSYVIVVPRN